MEQRGKGLCCFSNLQPSAVGQSLGLDEPSPALFVCRQCFPNEREGLARHNVLQLVHIQRTEIFRNTREKRRALRTKHAQKECFAAAAFLFEKSRGQRGQTAFRVPRAINLSLGTDNLAVAPLHGAIKKKVGNEKKRKRQQND